MKFVFDSRHCFPPKSDFLEIGHRKHTGTDPVVHVMAAVCDLVRDIRYLGLQ